jgi:hypothetical protein
LIGAAALQREAESSILFRRVSSQFKDIGGEGPAGGQLRVLVGWVQFELGGERAGFLEEGGVFFEK